MKKLLLFVFAAFAFAACTQDVEVQVSERHDAPETITVGFEGDDTRIQLNGAQKTVWTKGDLVSVFYRSNANQQWKYNGETGARTATLKRVDAGTSTRDMDRVVVVYPYNEDYYINPSTYNVQASLPATQTYLKNSYGLDGNIMISSAEYNDVTLKNVCGWLKLQLTGDGEVVKSITFKGNNGEQVAGELYINSADATAILASDMGDIAEGDGESATGGAGANLSFDDVVLKSVTLDCGEGVTLGAEATAFYIALPPQSFKDGFTVDVNCKGYKPMSISTQKDVIIERNHIQPMAEVAFSSEVRTIANNEIWYTATEKIEKSSWTFDTFGANIVSNEWDSVTGEGIIVFDGEVTEIGDYAFDNCDNLKTISFNNSITTIGIYAFQGCDLLSQIVIPGNIQKVGYLAFVNCTNVSSIVIEAGDTELSLAYSFDNITSTTLYVDRDLCGGYNYSPFENVGISTIGIGPNMKYIDMYVFSNCSHIQSINVSSESQLEKIGYCAFYNSNIKGLSIPSSVTEIDSTSFAMTTGMDWFKGGSSVYWVGMNGELAYEEASLRTLLRWPSGYSSVIISSYYYDKIGEWSFSGIDNLRYVNIVMYDGSTIEIDDCAFWHCEDLESLEGMHIPGAKMNVSAIGSSVFGYTAVEELNFLDSTFTSINGTFRECKALQSLYLPATLAEIGDGSFENCQNLTSLYIAATTPPILSSGAFNVVTDTLKIYVPVKSINAYKSAEGWSVFADRFVGYNFETGEIVESEPTPANNEIWYTSSDGNVVTPNSTDVFGANIISNTYIDGKGIITFDGDVIKIGNDAFFGCSCLVSVTIPESVTEIGVYAFMECSNLTIINIPRGVTEIFMCTFYGCSNLISVTIPEGVLSIHEGVFENCSSLTSITIPESVTEIGGYAFSGCSNLKNVYCKATKPSDIYWDNEWFAFENNAPDRKIYVPTASVDTYKSAKGWSEYKTAIVGYDFDNDVVVE